MTSAALSNFAYPITAVVLGQDQGGKFLVIPPTKIIDLVARYQRNAHDYESDYNERRLRAEFLDPFFSSLGWDVTNEQGWAEAYKDVVQEDTVRVDDRPKMPDYSFRVGGTRKFFVEAKKPSVDLWTNKEGPFQLRRYAWTAKLPLSILTNFREFAWYDCTFKPDIHNSPSQQRLGYITFEEYGTKWEEISTIFSKNAVYLGSFDRYAATMPDKGSTQVDDAFLLEIESWREILARNLAARNPDLTERELNHAVQSTIDRIVFLRICEDRGIEEYRELQKQMTGSDVYGQLMKLFRRADARYNSGLFHFRKERDNTEEPDSLTPTLRLDDDRLRSIVNHLYYPHSPYEFSVLPADILGQVYERFLGKVIRLTSRHDVHVDLKPEVRKSGGVYYTPNFVVEYIVRGTLHRVLEGRTIEEADNLRIVDPACGSGSFLIAAYQSLLDWYRNKYEEQGVDRSRDRVYPDQVGALQLTVHERKRILSNSIYGVDIDAQAVEVTKLSLLLKVLEDKSIGMTEPGAPSNNERILPDLDGNIRCGNSLVAPDLYAGQESENLSADDIHRINAFDWLSAFPAILQRQNPGFDVVIGNPPYDVLEKDRGKTSWPHAALQSYVRLNKEYDAALGGKLNLFRFFMVRSFGLLRSGGGFGMIVPLAILGDITSAKTRKYLLGESRRMVVDCFPQKDVVKRRIFRDAKLSTVVIICEKEDRSDKSQDDITVRVYPGKSFDEPHLSASIRVADLALLDPHTLPVPLVDEAAWRVCQNLHAAEKVKRLGDLDDFKVTRGEINQTTYRAYITSDPTAARMLKGVEVGRYHLNRELSQGDREWFNEDAFLLKNQSRPLVHERRIAIQRITGIDERLRIVATIVDPPLYFADSTNSISIREDSPYGLEYLLALLNSTLFQWRFKLTSTNNNVAGNELDSMPIREVDFGSATDQRSFDEIVRLSRSMLDLYARLGGVRTDQEHKAISQRIEWTDRRLNQSIYSLYSLSEEQINVIESSRNALNPAETLPVPAS